MENPRRILITGHTGFVGKHLVEQCRRRYPHATLFGLASHETPSPLQDEVFFLRANIVNRVEVQEAIAKARPDLIFHLAAQASVARSWQDSIETLRVNAEGTVNLLEAVRSEYREATCLLIGSGEQYGMIQPGDNPINEECPFRPANPYAVSKAAQDLYGYQYFAAYKLPVVRVRSFNHFGPGQAPTFAIASFAQQIARIEVGGVEPVLQVGNLEAKRDFLPVEDVVNAYLALAEQGHVGTAYNVGSGTARSMQSILASLLSLTEVKIEIKADPSRVRPVDIPLLEADISRIRLHTGWEPRFPFERALRRTLDYWRTVVASERAK